MKYIFTFICMLLLFSCSSSRKALNDIDIDSTLINQLTDSSTITIKDEVISKNVAADEDIYEEIEENIIERTFEADTLGNLKMKTEIQKTINKKKNKSKRTGINYNEYKNSLDSTALKKNNKEDIKRIHNKKTLNKRNRGSTSLVCASLLVLILFIVFFLFKLRK